MSYRGYSKKNRKARRKSRRTKRFGVLTHRGASQVSLRKHHERIVTLKVHVRRNTGAAREGQYCAWAKIPRAGRRAPRTAGVGMRSADLVCGPTPTTAVKRALRVFLRGHWTR